MGERRGKSVTEHNTHYATGVLPVAPCVRQLRRVCQFPVALFAWEQELVAVHYPAGYGMRYNYDQMYCFQKVSAGRALLFRSSG